MDFLDRPNLENPHKTPTSQAKPGAKRREFAGITGRPELVQNVEDGHIAAYGIVLPATCHTIRLLSFSARALRCAVFRSFIREKMRSHSEVSVGMRCAITTRRRMSGYSSEKWISMCGHSSWNVRLLSQERWPPALATSRRSAVALSTRAGMLPPKQLATARRSLFALAERTPAACLAWPTPCGAGAVLTVC